MNRSRTNLHFALAAIVLAASGALLSEAKSNGWLRILKKPLPLRKALDEFDQKSIAPWQLLNAGKLSAEAEEELGTKSYLNWLVNRPNPGPWRQVMLLITYYTGKQDQVPHVPEECEFQGGLTQWGGKVMFNWNVSGTGENVEVGRVVFDDPKQYGLRLVSYYTIAINGEFKGDRNGVRIRMSDPIDTHLYYSKAEVAIWTSTEAKLEELDRAARDLLERTLGELVRNHWPPRGSERGGPKE